MRFVPILLLAIIVACGSATESRCTGLPDRVVLVRADTILTVGERLPLRSMVAGIDDPCGRRLSDSGLAAIITPQDPSQMRGVADTVWSLTAQVVGIVFTVSQDQSIMSAARAEWR